MSAYGTWAITMLTEILDENEKKLVMYFSWKKKVKQNSKIHLNTKLSKIIYFTYLHFVRHFFSSTNSCSLRVRNQKIIILHVEVAVDEKKKKRMKNRETFLIELDFSHWKYSKFILSPPVSHDFAKEKKASKKKNANFVEKNGWATKTYL